MKAPFWEVCTVQCSLGGRMEEEEEEEEEGGQHGDIDFGTKYGSHQDPTQQCTVHCTKPATRFAVVKVHQQAALTM